MRNLFIHLTIALVVLLISFSACSKAKDEESSKGAIDKMTDRAAERAVKKIKTPIDKARAIQEKEGERTKAMDEAVKE
jgi:hypothetical protein